MPVGLFRVNRCHRYVSSTRSSPGHLKRGEHHTWLQWQIQGIEKEEACYCNGLSLMTFGMNLTLNFFLYKWGGGHGLFEGRYRLPNYRPCFLPCRTLSFLWPPPIFEGHRPSPPKITYSQCIITSKRDPNYFSKLSIQ